MINDKTEEELLVNTVPFEEVMDKWQADALKREQAPRIVKLFTGIWDYIHYRIPEWPSDIKMAIVTFYQRGRRGWSTYDIWSLDSYHDDVMIGALQELKKKKQGYPCAIEVDYPNPPTDEDARFNYFLAQWDYILDSMIKGFEANKRIGDGCLYEDELGPYPMFSHRNATPEQLAAKDEHIRKCDELEKRDREILQKGLAMFSKYYRSLWW